METDTLQLIETLQQRLEEYKDPYVHEVLDTLYNRFNRIDRQLVAKNLIRGPRGAYYYVNSRGKITYLNKRQKKRLEENELIGCLGDYCNT